MRETKQFVCDGNIPSDDELSEAIAIAEQENCIVELRYIPNQYFGMYSLFIVKGMTIEDCRSKSVVTDTYVVQ